MRQISDVLEQMLMAQGMSAGRAGTLNAHGMGAGCATGGNAHPATAQAGEGTSEPMGMGKDAGRNPRQVGGRETKFQVAPIREEALSKIRMAFPYEVHTNPAMSRMPMRQTTQTPRAFAPRGAVSLMVIVGGKA